MSGPIRTCLRLLLVTVVTAGVLRVLDAVPRFIAGLPRGVVALRGMADAEARGLVLPMPSLYPDHLEWPPWRLVATRDGHVAATIRQRQSGAPWLIAASAPAASPVVSPALLTPYAVLQDVDVDGRPGPAVRVERLGDPRGTVWHQATWVSNGRRMVLRYRGPLSELLQMAQPLGRRSLP